MNIGELSQRSGVSRDALRLYERRGLIRSDRKSNGYRDFDPATERLVGMIRLGQALGFSLREIGEVTRTMADDSLSAADTEALLRGKINEVSDRMRDLKQLRGMLEDAIRTVCPLRA